MQQGDMEAGAWSCGMVAGLIHDVPTCRELVDRIMDEAESIIARRLQGMHAGYSSRNASPATNGSASFQL